MKIGCVRGVPGAGKTRYIVDLIRKAALKYGPECVGAISYSNAAVNELKARAITQAGFLPDSAVNIRTLHSHCWRLLRMTRQRHAESHVQDFNEATPQFAISTSGLQDDTISSNTRRNDRLYSIQGICRSTCLPIDRWPLDVRLFYAAWNAWMKENDMLDYTGMLETVLKLGECPQIDVLFVDEAQDMSELFKRITFMWARETVSTIWCGDSDQAIFRFAGSDPAVFDDLCDRADWLKVLDQSHRVPRAVLRYAAGNTLNRITGRKKIDIKPTDAEGAVVNASYPDLSLPGSHMILCRCNYQLTRWIDYLTQNGTLWHNPYRDKDLYWNPSKTKVFQAVKAYRKLMAGGDLGLAEIKVMADCAISKGNLARGAKTALSEIDHIQEKEDIFGIGHYGFLPSFLDQRRPISEKFRLTIKAGALLDRDESIVDQEPRVIVGTTHSVKGGEAAHVWVDRELPTVVRREMSRSEVSRNDEFRVQYVAATRAKTTLGLLS